LQQQAPPVVNAVIAQFSQDVLQFGSLGEFEQKLFLDFVSSQSGSQEQHACFTKEESSLTFSTPVAEQLQWKTQAFSLN
jgi:hypothetical protein